MEKDLILFAKIQGYITASVMMCSGIALAVWFSEPHTWELPVHIFLSSICPILLVYGCIKEDAGWLKPAKWLCVVVSIVGFLFLSMATSNNYNNDYNHPLTNEKAASLAIFAVSLYGIYVVGFLEKLFKDLNQRRTGFITLTTIVLEAPSTVPPQIVLPDGATQPSSQPAVVATPAPPVPQTKEFPTWT